MAKWSGNVLISQFTPMLLESIRFSTLYVFGVFCLLGIFLSAWLPVTKGAPLEAVQRLFDQETGFKSTAEVTKAPAGEAALDAAPVGVGAVGASRCFHI